MSGLDLIKITTFFYFFIYASFSFSYVLRKRNSVLETSDYNYSKLKQSYSIMVILFIRGKDSLNTNNIVLVCIFRFVEF